MHGLVLTDKHQQVLRPSIIWCDSRASAIGHQAFHEIGEKECLENLLNSPGNFTASKLKWVKDNEPELYARIDKFMLPGDYIAMKLSGHVQTTASGLSEGILWNFRENKVARMLLDHYGFHESLIPEIVPTFSVQAEVSETAARELGTGKGY
ncbi:MAG: FGGY family carbohydrate kinase [Mangrovibacterium sp.]